MTKEAGIVAGKASKDLELLKRHVAMLQIVAEHGPIGIIKLSEKIGLPQHRVRYSLRLLEEEGLIKASTAGAKATRKVEKFLEDISGHLDVMNLAIEDVRKDIEKLKKAMGK